MQLWCIKRETLLARFFIAVLSVPFKERHESTLQHLFLYNCYVQHEMIGKFIINMSGILIENLIIVLIVLLKYIVQFFSVILHKFRI